jgi:hypothetical protein
VRHSPLRWIWPACFFLFASKPALLRAQTDATGRVSVDLAARAFDRVLPFDVPFFIAGLAPEGARSLEVQHAVIPKSGDITNLLWMPSEPARWTPDRPAGANHEFLVLVGTPLESSRRYLFRFSFDIEGSANRVLMVEGRTSGNTYVGADVGVLYAGDLGIGAFYAGSNIYFRPVNKGAPLGEVGSIGRRLALTVGLTISSVADEGELTRSDLFWNQSLVLGCGYRLTSSIRGGGGALIFREANKNPLISQKTLAATWYVSFSFDIDVARGLAR